MSDRLVDHEELKSEIVRLVLKAQEDYDNGWDTPDVYAESVAEEIIDLFNKI